LAKLWSLNLWDL